jgi:hypothetical protein
MKTTFVKVLLGLVWTIATAGVAMPQASPLGSPADVAGRYSTNYEVAVRSALPKVDADTVTKLMATVREDGAAEKPLAITNPRELERVFGLRERGEADASGFFDVGEAVYQVDDKRHRIYLAHRYSDVRGVPRKEFERQLAEIRTVHRELVERLGIPRREVMFTDFREILSETDGHPKLENGYKGEILCVGAVTTILRSVGGILVEGSYLRLSSVDPKRLDLVDVRWPAVRLAEGVLKEGVRSPEESLQNIVKRVASNSKGQAVNVRMAVVLRPVTSDRESQRMEFVPSLKVGVATQSMKTEDGYRTDAGEVFYIDLVRGAQAFAEEPARDTAEPKSQR